MTLFKSLKRKIAHLRKRNLLSGQKPVKRKKTRTRPNPIWVGLTAIFLAIVSIAISSSLKPDAIKNPKIAFYESAKLHEDLKVAIATAINERIKADPDITLAELTAHVKTQLNLSNLAMIRLSANHLIVSSQYREPNFYVKLDKLRPVSFDNKIYVAAKDVRKEQPVLHGVPFTREALNTSSDGSLALGLESYKIIQEARILLTELQKEGLKTNEITYQKYRGFKFILNETQEIFIGRAPFNPRLKRLNETLSRLAATGQIAQRIELDYKGKAFIKSANL